MPSIKCPHCGGSLKVPDSALGKTGKCPKCQQKFVVELPKLAELPAADPYALAPLDDPAPGPPLTSARPATLGFPSAATTAPMATNSLGAPAKTAVARPAWLIPAAIAGGILLLLVAAGVMIAVIGMLGADGDAVAGGGAVPAAGGGGPAAGKASGIIDLTREAEPGENSPVPVAPLQGAEAGWKVTVDGVAAPAGWKSAFALNRNPQRTNSEVSGVVFSSPTSAKAAVFHRDQANGLEWTQYDLTKDEPGNRVTLFPELEHRGKPLLAALSPSGELLALRSPFQGDESPGVVYVCDTEGKPIARVELTIPSDQIAWVAMADESRLLVLAGDRIRGFEVPSGMPRFEIIGVVQPPTLSPGGKWLAALTSSGVRWYSANEGVEAGQCPLPEKWFEPMPGRDPRADLAGKRIGRIAIAPSGKQAVALVSNPYGELYVANWDLATGKALGAFVLPWSQTQADLTPECIWTGERQILLASGHLVDLDAQTWVARYDMGLFVPSSPDSRAWRILPLALMQRDAVLAKLPPAQAEMAKQTGAVLAAATIPPADAAQQIAQAKQGLLWHPGMEVRLEVSGRLPTDERDATLKIISDTIAQMGYRINPKAKYGIRTNIGVEDGLVVVRTEPHAEPNMEWAFYGQGSKGKVQFSVVDQQNNPMFAVPAWIEVDRSPKAGGEKAAWAELHRRLVRIELPRVYFRDAAGKRLPLTMHVGEKIPIGIDGILEAPQPDYTPTDSFELPAERGY
jgi:hypothetical protein